MLGDAEMKKLFAALLGLIALATAPSFGNAASAESLSSQEQAQEAAAAAAQVDSGGRNDGTDRCAYLRSDPRSALCAEWEQADFARGQAWIQGIALASALLTLFFTYRSLRAYVFFGYGNLTPWEDKVALDVCLKNQGGTPAEILEWALYDAPVLEFARDPHYPTEGRKRSKTAPPTPVSTTSIIAAS